jgi:pyridoxamine 5'-phosphate oxidase
MAPQRLHWYLTRFNERNADPDPIRQFQKWFKAALKAGLKEPTAMTLATATRSGKPSARMVLLKGVDQKGFVFFTNYESRKGHELQENPHAALVFYWTALDRQIRVTGRVSKVTPAESDQYFDSRPLGSRFSAAVSKQSSIVKSRAALEADLAKLKTRYPETGPERPRHWGGYRVDPGEIEFWQQGEYRLHDRLRYRKRRDGTWRIDRLAP